MAGPLTPPPRWSIFHAGGPFHRLVGFAGDPGLSGGYASSPMTHQSCPVSAEKNEHAPGTSWLSRGPGITSRAFILADKTNASIIFGRRCRCLLCDGPSFPFL